VLSAPVLFDVPILQPFAKGTSQKGVIPMNIGSIKAWLNLHTYFGLIGFLLVMLHAGFPFQFRYSAFNAGTVSNIFNDHCCDKWFYRQASLQAYG